MTGEGEYSARQEKGGVGRVGPLWEMRRDDSNKVSGITVDVGC